MLERGLDHARKLPPAWQPGALLADAASDWTVPATPGQLCPCGLPADSPALWHIKAGWIKPSSLVKAWLATPGVTWHGHAEARALVRQTSGWQVLDAAGQELGTAELLVLAAGHNSRALADSAGLATPLALQAIRGQASWALHAEGTAGAMPPFPVNGHGSLIPQVPLENGVAWVAGATFARDNISTGLHPEDTAHNLDKLQTLLPVPAQTLAMNTGNDQVQGWAGIRCATPSRLPFAGPVEGQPGLWVSTGMGSRGLTFAALCAELLAARLHGEPLPVEQRLADALLPQYATRPQDIDPRSA